MQDPDKRNGYLRMADTMPSQLLIGEKPRLIDEWQEAPVLWDAIRFDVDRSGEWGQYILTGSATPRDDEKPRHSGTGRIARLKMRPMSLYESRESNGTVSLARLFAGETGVISGNSLTVPMIAKIICRGGWPEAVAKSTMSPQIARNYVDAVINADIQSVDGVDRSPHRVRHCCARMLETYPRWRRKERFSPMCKPTTNCFRTIQCTIIQMPFGEYF